MYYWAEGLVHSPLPYTRERGQCVPSTRKVLRYKEALHRREWQLMVHVAVEMWGASGEQKQWEERQSEFSCVVSSWCIHEIVFFEYVCIYSHMHVCAWICSIPVRFKGLKGLTNMHLRENLPERFPFTFIQATPARDSRDTEQQCGRRRKQPVSNLFLQSTVKIPAERSHLSQSCSM